MSRRLVFVTRILTFMSRRLVFVTHRVMFIVPQNRICYAQSSKCSYNKFRKNFWGTFHNFEEVFSYVRNKI